MGFEFHEGKIQEVVYLRVKEEDEWRMQVEFAKYARKTETIDNGETRVRADQAQHKFVALGEKLQNAADLVDARVETSKKRVGLREDGASSVEQPRGSRGQLRRNGRI